VSQTANHGTATDPRLSEAFRNPKDVAVLLKRIRSLAVELDVSAARPLLLMEVCGTHTMAIAKFGLRSVLPEGIRLLSGPGCPVCVTANYDIDRIIATSRIPGLTITTFGDMLRVPGSSSSLLERRAEGAEVLVVYSPLDALAMAATDPERQVVFVGVGFETTTPIVAAAVRRAAEADLRNFSVLAAHKRVPPALTALLADPDLQLDGLILPGHVSTILGEEPYAFIPRDFKIPAVICGFEPVDILECIALLLEQVVCLRTGGELQVLNAYRRAVMPEGNPTARAVIEQVFDPTDAEWRGLGSIAGSGYQLQSQYAGFDAAARFHPQVEPTVEPKGCRCGEVLRGIMAPNDCPLFGKTCTPEHPVGPCMVSSEGSCAAYHNYRISI